VDVLLEDVGFAYGSLPVLSGVSFEIKHGETTALIGPSGCGKSTLLSLVGGMLAQQRGRIVSVGSAPPACLNPITFVFQDFALLPWRTAAGNIEFALEHHAFDAARVDEVLELCGLREFAHAYPKQLSGGMRQRVGLARALVVKPALLLMDEPLSALDAQTRELLMADLLAIWARERTTTLYVTHNLDEALRLADQIIVLSRRPGRVVRTLRPELPVRERSQQQHAAKMRELLDELWTSIRAEAQLADREVQSG
jgi:NitT/TauT family transport system ATP-binding protein